MMTTAFMGRSSGGHRAAGCDGTNDRHIRRAAKSIKRAGEDSAEAKIPTRRAGGRLPSFLRLSPDDGGRGAEKHQGLGAERRLEKAEIRTENSQASEHCRERRQRDLHHHCVEHHDMSLNCVRREALGHEYPKRSMKLMVN
jgi:hypothetical protein